MREIETRWCSANLEEDMGLAAEKQMGAGNHNVFPKGNVSFLVVAQHLSRSQLTQSVLCRVALGTGVMFWAWRLHSST